MLQQVNIDVFKCAKGGGPCLGGVTVGALNSNPHKCDEGYDDGQTSPFCGVCEDSYSMKSGACVDCGGVEVLGLLVRLAIGLVLLGILGCIMRTAPFEVYFAVFKIAWPRFKQLLAILITNYQVLGNLPARTGITFPTGVTTSLGLFSDVVNFDALNLPLVACGADALGTYPKFLLNMLLPLFICLGIYKYADYKCDKMREKNPIPEGVHWKVSFRAKMERSIVTSEVRGVTMSRCHDE